MKILLFVLLLVLPALVVNSQTATPEDVSDVTVIEYSWRFEVRNPMMDQDPMLAAKQQEERQAAQERSVKDPKPHRPAILNEGKYGEDPKERSSGIYIYKIKVKNSAKRTLEGIELDYVFADPETKLELARLILSSSSRIKAGKTRTLVFRSVSPPTGAIDEATAGKDPKKMFIESIVIQSVRYKQK